MIARRIGPVVVALSLAPLGPACPAQPPPPHDDPDIVVYGRGLRQIGTATSGSQGTVGYEDFRDRPLSRVGELVENVPGVIATQHSGSGKANQYFLRGFNLDHGTDFAGFVDGAPINMRSHGHGQGYLDLNFLIPELVERIDYRKGPYFADVGDFSAAGTVKFVTAETLPRPIVEVTAGSFGYYRGLAAGSARLGQGDLLVGLEGVASDGPWVLDERLRKANALVRYSGDTRDGRWSVGLAAYHARWNATDQVPERALVSGAIGRFGNIDPYLGGRTTRVGLSAQAGFGHTEVSLYAISYRFALTSNFTYFLDDPVDGDEFQQRDRRVIFGGAIRRTEATTILGLPITLAVGGDVRYDRITQVGLYHSVRGVRTGTVRQDRVGEASAALYAEGTAKLTDRLRLVLGLRGDLYGYDVRAEISPENGGRGHDVLLSPKAALAWRAADHLEFYANYGEGFHSNDVRGATIRTDPGGGDPPGRVAALVKARGAEVGARVEDGRVTASLVGFYLTLGSELVFAGDGGTTEPNAASRRYGTEASLFWRPRGWLTLDAAAAVTHARFADVAPGQARIPNSVGRVLSGGATAVLGHGFSVTARLRHFGGAPLIEDGKARSDPTTLVNLGTYWQRGRVRVGFDVLNLLDARSNDITYFYTSRLPGEPTDGVAERHLHPVEPRQVRCSFRYSW